MKRDPATLDSLARRFVQGSEKYVRKFLAVEQLDPALVAIMYLHVRGVIERCEEEDAVDELALAIYLTAATWQASDDPPVDLLPALHTVIRRTLDTDVLTLGKESS